MNRLIRASITKGCNASSSGRCYSIAPPVWMGGLYKYDPKMKYEFPDCTESFAERMTKLKKLEEALANKPKAINIGEEYKPVRSDRSTQISIAIANKKNKELEKEARLRKLNVPLDEVKREWVVESGPLQTKLIADHYGIYEDLFDGNYFYPVIDIAVHFKYSEDLATPVFRGNILEPTDCKEEPEIDYKASSNKFYTLLLTNPDGHLAENSSEYVHWLVGNIPGSDVSNGEELINYLQPFPVRGTGFHRHVFVLFEQTESLDFAAYKRSSPCNSLDDRTFKTSEFYEKFHNSIMPKGLAFFQSQWDESVRTVFHNILDQPEPSYEYVYPPFYHPPAKKYPHREPFNRYFDRYRDKKDIAEEVLRMKLKMTCPFEGRPRPEKYPMIHKPKSYKPTWIRDREDLMHRRIEQFKDLN